MALIRCTECGKEISDKAAACVHCGCPIETAKYDRQEIDYQKLYNMFDGDFSAAINHVMDIYDTKEAFDGIYDEMIEFFVAKDPENIAAEARLAESDAAVIRAAEERIAAEAEVATLVSGDDNVARCPKCGSTSLTANKKGFGIGKAVVGFALTGGLGLAAGNIGAKKVRITCLKCGHHFMAGKGA